MTDNIMFSGSILFLSLADVIQLLGGNNCTGILTLRSQYSADMGVIYFIGGNPVNASCGKLKGLEAVYALFGWTDGKYEFSEAELTGINPVIKQGRMAIVMDAVRMLDDGQIAKVGPDPLNQKDMEKTGSDGIEMDFVHPVKGPLVDYQCVMGEYSYKDGATIVKEGKYGKWMWVIYEGTVKITRETSKGAITLARLGEGCFIGTIRALMHGEYSRSATAIAEGKVRLSMLDAEPLQREYAALSENFRKILISLDNRLRLINDNVVAAYIGGYSKGLPKDKVFENRFQNNTDLYIIRKGTADIIGKGPKEDVNLLSLGSDDVFGKIPFMDFGHEPLSASVMTSDPFEADILDSQALQEEYDNLSPTFRNFVFNAATNISMTTKLFYQLLEKVDEKDEN
jgi:cAMP-binding proteins - catabolite gene activator and regulatory subunit of cAMP-dependent protein kinases